MRSIFKYYEKADNPENELFVRKLLSEELDARRAKHQKAAKQIIFEKKLLKANMKRKEELLLQIEELKHPKKIETEDKCLTEDNSPSRFTGSTKPSSEKLAEEKREDNLLMDLTEKLNKNIFTLHYLKDMVNEEKLRKSKFEKELYAQSSYLSDKFSVIFNLEIRLDKMKAKGKGILVSQEN